MIISMVTGGSINEWLLVALIVALAIQSAVLLLVLLRLNRLLKSVGAIGVRLHLASKAAQQPAGHAAPDAKPVLPATTAQTAGEAEKPASETFTNSLGMAFARIGPAEFSMGSSDAKSPDNEKPAHNVRLTQACWMAVTPVTNAQYEQFDPDHRKLRPAWNGDDHPVIFTSWNEATAFCLWLSQRDGREYRLPTEAQWEFAARGTDGRIFPWGNQWDPSRCNSAEEGSDFDQTSPVGRFPQGVSPHGVLDMVGNVWEWCFDWYEPGYGSGVARTDPVGPASGQYKACRGGSWMNHGYSCRVTMRARRAVDFSDAYIGFRVVCVGDAAADAAPAEKT
ncbi:MAG: formylglycine-generating enzyme family protein [Verrucomicrobia bacterium]|nr:formylglycine-generating enzyme family protein [Verrucomicrobiota bacterium]